MTRQNTIATEKGMTVSKLVRRSAIVTLLLVGVAACSESSSTAPVPVSSQITAASVEEPLLAYSGDADSDDRDDDVSGDVKYGSRKFKIRPGKAVLKKLGGHILYIPANVVCDPASSGYGRAFWDQPCKVAKRQIEVTAEWAIYKDRAAIRFKPDLRFVPTTDRRRWVILAARHDPQIDPAAYYTLLWRDPETGQWIDEAESDPTVRAQVDRWGKTVARRLKHFSDYWLWFGFGSYNVTSGIGLGGDMWEGW
jgi:hypothetical protein